MKSSLHFHLASLKCILINIARMYLDINFTRTIAFPKYLFRRRKLYFSYSVEVLSWAKLQA